MKNVKSLKKRGLGPFAVTTENRIEDDLRPFGPQAPHIAVAGSPGHRPGEGTRGVPSLFRLELDRSHAQRASPYLSHALAILVVADNSVSGINR